MCTQCRYVACRHSHIWTAYSTLKPNLSHQNDNPVRMYKVSIDGLHNFGLCTEFVVHITVLAVIC